jgi:hypothetical protein
MDLCALVFSIPFACLLLLRCFPRSVVVGEHLCQFAGLSAGFRFYVTELRACI